MWGFFGLMALAVVTIHLVSSNARYTLSVPTTTSGDHVWNSKCPEVNYSRAVANHASEDGTIILALVDEAFADMALNLYLMSFRPHGIKNFLFVGASSKACEIVSKMDLPCISYAEDKDSGKASTYMSKDFLRKMNIRTYMISDALQLGFTVLHTDLDMYFIKNPMPLLAQTSGDLVSLWDDFVHNAGFVLVRPTSFGKKIYHRMDELTRNNPKMDDQTALNSAVKSFKANKKFKAVALDRKKFLCGLDYFEKGKRLFPAPCDVCMVVHNNWIVSMEAKVYRFKEHLMWGVDHDGYYSSKTAKYLIYDNVINLKNEKDNNNYELDSLKTALAIGQVLNRKVILPKFHCGSKGDSPCPLNSLLRIAPFDKNFGSQYREHSFFENPLVPLMSRSDIYAVVTPKQMQLFKDNKVTLDKNIIVKSKDGHIVTEDEIKSWFGVITQSVLRFHSFYGLEMSFNNPNQTEAFSKHVKDGFVPGKYRQL